MNRAGRPANKPNDAGAGPLRRLSRAEALAGYQKNPGSYSLLLPRALTASLETTTIAACAP